MLLMKTHLLPMVDTKPELGKELTLGAGVDLEGDVRWSDVELLEFITQRAGFTSVEIGPLVSNTRADKTYKPETLELTGYSPRAFTMIETFKKRNIGEKPPKISASVQPSFSLMNLPHE
jgi:hypothetical protein